MPPVRMLRDALDINMKECEVLDKWKWDMSGQSHVSKIDQCQAVKNALEKTEKEGKE